MNPLVPIAILWLAVRAVKSSKPEPSMLSEKAEAMRAMIRKKAREMDVPEQLALATARVESSFDPTREGDLKWSQSAKNQARIPKANPYHAQLDLWHSYGLFQLLAPYHVAVNEDPRVLLDPRINIDRGIKYLRQLLRVHGRNDWDRVRLAYTGALNLSQLKQEPILRAWHRALKEEEVA